MSESMSQNDQKDTGLTHNEDNRDAHRNGSTKDLIRIGFARSAISRSEINRRFHVGDATLRDFCDIAIWVAILKGCPLSPEDAFVPILVNNPAYWRNRAEETRALADEMTDVLAKLRMLKLVQDYEELAVRAENRLRERQKFSPS